MKLAKQSFKFELTYWQLAEFFFIDVLIMVLCGVCGYYTPRRKTRTEKIQDWIAVPFRPFGWAIRWSSQRMLSWYFQPPPVRKFYASQAKANRHKNRRLYGQCPFPSAHKIAEEELSIKRQQQIEEIVLPSNNRKRMPPMRV